MIRKRFWLVTVIALATVGAAFLGTIGSPIVSANDEPQGSLEISAREAAVELLTAAQSELAEDAVAGSTPPEWPVIAGYVVNILEGPEGEHFNEEYALSSVPYGAGALAYVEETTGLSAAAFADGDIAELINDPSVTAETEALLRLLLVKELLVQEEIDSNVLTTAGEHLNAALSLLQSIDAN